MTPERLGEIEGRVMLTSPGPWRVEVPPDKGYPQRVYDRKNGLIAECFLGPQYPLAEAEFIAAARTDVPELVVEVRALEAENARLRAVLQDFADHGLRADLTPTIDGSTDVYAQMSRYLRRLDATVRERARRALAPVADPDPHTTSDEETSNG